MNQGRVARRYAIAEKRYAEPKQRISEATYRPSFADMARKLSMAGYTAVSDIAAAIGRSEGTIYRWLKEEPSFALAVQQGQILAALRVQDVVMNAALAGDARLGLDILKLRVPGYRPSAKVEQSLDANTLAALMEKHKLRDMDALRAAGLIEDDDEEPDA